MIDRRSCGQTPGTEGLLEHVYAVPLVDRWLLHAPLHSITAVVNASAIRELKASAPDPVRKSVLAPLIEAPPADPPRPLQNSLQPEFLGIIPSRRCNLNCVYCGFGAEHASASILDPSLAIAAVDWMVEQAGSNRARAVDIHFFGGEPFVAPDVVDVVVHRARVRAAQRGLECRFEADTNGYFDEVRCRFVGDYFTSVVLSMDGPEEIHNRQRPTNNGRGSFRDISRNAAYLSTSPVELCLRVCVSSLNVRELERITRWFCKQFRPAMIDFEPLKPTPGSNRAGLRTPDPWEFAVQFLRAHRVASEFGVRAVYAAAAIDKTQLSFCPVGRDTVIVSPDGMLSACYSQIPEWEASGLNFMMGRLESSGKVFIDGSVVERIRNLPGSRIRCLKCFARWHCGGGCYLMNHQANRGREYDEFCIRTRLITAGLLLDRLGDHETLRKLLRIRRAAEALVSASSDRLSDWEG